MAKTFILKIDELIEFLQKCKKDGHEMVVFAVGSCYEAYAPSKKKQYYKLKFAMAHDIFKEEGIAPFIYHNNIDFCGVILDKTSAEHLKKREA